MDESVREMIGCCYLALADAAGLGVLGTANKTIMAAVENGGVRDPVARQALTVLVQACQPDDTASDVKDEMAAVEEGAAKRLQLIARLKTIVANLEGVASALAAATGEDHYGRLLGHIRRRVDKVTLHSPLEDLLALSDMVEALGGLLDRTRVDA
jgi:hypothetical protein